MQYATWCHAITVTITITITAAALDTACCVRVFTLRCGQAKQLAADGHLYYATCSTLESELLGMDPASLLPYNEGKPELFATYLDGAMGFK